MNSAQKKSFSAAELASTSLFKGLSPVSLEDVAKAARTRTIQEGEFFFHIGDPSLSTHVLISGKVKLTQVTPEGQQVIMRYIGPVEEFAVIAVLSEVNYPVSAEAVEESTALTWDKESIQRLMEKHPTIAINAIQILASRVQEFQDRLRELSTERVERRVARALLRLVRQSGRKIPEGILIDLPLSRQDLAEMTATTLYTVSRILSHWETQGLVQSGRERIVIRQPHSLVVIAEDLPQGFPVEDEE